jgi:hypothetical protein
MLSRKLAILAASVFCAPAIVAADPTISSMFSETSFDFGNVARNATIEHHFLLTNMGKQEIQLSGVRTSCGCTTPTVETPSIKPGETGSVLAHFNTDRFLGQRGATLTVTITKPYYIEVPLKVSGYIRQDVVVDPQQLSFGNVDQGSSVEKKFAVNYAGRSDWKITAATPTQAFLKTTLAEKSRLNGKVSYEVSVILEATAPAGTIQDQIWLTTNDVTGTKFPVMVSGTVERELTISPVSLNLGDLQTESTVVRSIVLKARKPFKITDAAGGAGFSFKVSDEEKQTHVVTVTYSSVGGNVVLTPIHLHTTLPSHSDVEIPVTGKTASPLASSNTQD